MKLAVSILGIIDNQDKIDMLNINNVDYIHLDVMDNKFVNNYKVPSNKIKYNKILDVHLMVYDIEKYLDYYKGLDINNITFHYEIGDTLKYINMIKNMNYKVGLAVNPDTKIEDIVPFLDKIDIVLLMSVQPGYGGQKFIFETIKKIDYLKKYRLENSLNYLIEIDGGINDETVKKINIDTLVVGSFITNSDDYDGQIRKLDLK